MRSKIILLITMAFVTMSFNSAGSLTDAERKHARNLLQETQENLLKTLSGLSPEQLSFKADASSWSISECLEHIAIAENNFVGLMQTALKEPADPSKRSEVKMSDEAI